MSEEEKLHEEKECKCFCHNKEFKKFLIIALGTFVGVYCALCLFSASHRPPMMAPYGLGPQGGMQNRCPYKMIHHHHHFDKAKRQINPDFQKPEDWKNGPAPFDANRRNDK